MQRGNLNKGSIHLSRVVRANSVFDYGTWAAQTANFCTPEISLEYKIFRRKKRSLPRVMQF